MLAIETASDDMQEWPHAWCPTCKAWRRIRLVYLDSNQNRMPQKVGSEGQQDFAQIRCIYGGHEIVHLRHSKY